jgi:hypothetical protein
LGETDQRKAIPCAYLSVFELFDRKKRRSFPMGIDFSDMLDEDDEAVLHPRDIFFTLDRSPTFSFPRDIQTEVMNRWFDDR